MKRIIYTFRTLSNIVYLVTLCLSYIKIIKETKFGQMLMFPIQDVCTTALWESILDSLN